jgi:hypothetical protein
MLRREFVVGIGAISLLVSGGRSFAQGIAAIKVMKPGEFIWRPELSPRGPVVIVVSIPHQLVHVYRNGLATRAQLYPIWVVKKRTSADELSSLLCSSRNGRLPQRSDTVRAKVTDRHLATFQALRVISHVKRYRALTARSSS